MQVLAALLEHSGEVVTRDELRNKLWPADTFVDFDHSLNAAIKRLRDALGESAETPIFVETVARRGYRFIKCRRFCGRFSGRRPAAKAHPRIIDRGRAQLVSRWPLDIFHFKSQRRTAGMEDASNRRARSASEASWRIRGTRIARR